MSATGPKNRIAVEGATGFLARAGYQKTQATVLDFSSQIGAGIEVLCGSIRNRHNGRIAPVGLPSRQKNLARALA